MKAAIYNPYLDSMGGGERYTLAVASYFASRECQVDIEWKDQTIKQKLEGRFGVNLDNVNFVESVKKGDGYDVCFWVSDGSIPLLRARKNLLHFQVPFHGVGGGSLMNRMKLFRINKIICNSSFTKKVIDKEYGVNSEVVYPPVSVEKFKPKRKENIILYVGRFSQLKQSKRQEVLIEAFRKFYKSGFRDYKLVLAGGTEVGSGDFVKSLRAQIVAYPIEIIESPSFKELVGLYAKAKFFWAAAGFGCNEKREPELVEHFGITLVEAMAAGVVPLVYEAGGFKEIIKNGQSGFFWKSVGELNTKTRRLVEDKKLLREISENSIERSRLFGYEAFNIALEKILA